MLHLPASLKLVQFTLVAYFVMVLFGVESKRTTEILTSALQAAINGVIPQENGILQR